ncbi:MAG TPA: ribosome small subunit-dependent GTPase A [Planctomycetota bacterium]
MPAAAAPEGLVTRVDARQCEVCFDGKTAPAQLRGRLFEAESIDRSPVAVGDRVRLTDEDGELAIDEVLPRRNVFARRASGEEVRRQLLAANVDQVVLVCSFGNPPFSSVTADRILVSASFLGVPARLILNKIDRDARGHLEDVRRTYELAGYPVLATSAETGEGVEAFGDLLRGRTSVLYGLSGVGKSSLLNCIEDGLGIRTRQVSKSLNSGRHTTTYARMYFLKAGGAVIDTPGVRVFRPFGIPPYELRLHFAEFVPLGKLCRFPSCQHRDEPGCAVLAALANGALAASRHRSYLEILEELERVYGGSGRNEDDAVV